MKSSAITLTRLVSLFFGGRYPLAFLGLLMISVLSSSAQQRVCGTMDYLENQLQSNPNLRYSMQVIERQTADNLKGAGHRLDRDIVIPVVVHVVYATGDQNISDAQIFSQLQVLNQDFRRQNPDQNQTPAEWAPVAVDTRISFRLANYDPQGRVTTGITRTRTNVQEFFVQSNGVKYSSMGGVDAWPTDKYLNIWVCNLGMGVLGYSQFPGGPAATDGVVIGYKFLGTTGLVRAPFDGGRTCTHEVGHWLNLRHIWGDGPCSVDDHVADTPPADRPTQGCPAFRSACNGPVMTSNFMDYTNDECMNLFTFGQADRMQALFLPGGARASLKNSNALAPEPAPVPLASLDVELISPSVAKLIWSNVNGAETYNVRFRRIGTEEWFRRTFNGTDVSANGLQPCTDYEFQMEPVIGGIGRGFSPSKLFRTEGCPNVGGPTSSPNVNYSPTGMQVTQAGPGAVGLRWDPVPGATGYRLQYKIAGSRAIQSATVLTPSVNIQNLETGRRYFWRVRADFSGQSGPFSPVESFSADASMANLRTVPNTRTTNMMEPVIEAPTNHSLRDGDLPMKLNLDSPSVFACKIINVQGRVVKEYPGRELRNREWIKVPITGLMPGRYQVILSDPDGFELMLNVRLE